ncbi:MAG: Na+:solute symporter [Deltaproteobacteria bacterium]|nr:Na+:solute symporter [Deltaproteobacteria bacterium]MBW2257443.1 Na+:solute symporter [Deltaproteobacteria bacterium]
MLHFVDAAVVVAWLGITLVLGVWFSRRASRSTEAFFVSDRSLPWWVVGTSMVATTFAADTPLVVSGLAMKGLHANWFWWTMGLTGTVSVFYFARLWRRSDIITDAELVELRYGGRAGRVLRGVKGLWFGVFMNLLVIAWVMRAMTKIVAVVLGLPEDAVLLTLPGGVAVTTQIAVVVALFALTAAYTGASGLYGVVATDVLQFVVAMAAAIGLAVVCWTTVGGRAGLVEGFAAHDFDWDALTILIPLNDSDPAGATAQFLVLVGVVWWTARNIDGGGYLSQRLFAAKDDQHAFWAYLWFTVALICLRPWPWVVVGLTGMALLGAVADPETYYPLMMVEMLPAGLFGLMLASFLAAFMSTIDTQLNWGASLVINDVYRRFLRPRASDRHHVTASRAAVVLLALAGAVVSFAIQDIEVAWKLAISVTAGLGSVYIARWYWWRVTAWSEIVAMGMAALCTFGFGVLAAHHPDAAEAALLADPETTFVVWAWLSAVPQGWLSFPFSAAATAVVVIACWLPITFLTAPDPSRPEAVAHLRVFYERVRPGGPGWRRVAHDVAGFSADGPTRHTALGALASMAAIYGVLLGMGELIVGRFGLAALALVVAMVAMLLAVREIGVDAGRFGGRDTSK